MNVCIVADWLPVFGGAEHVVFELHTLFPDAPIFTTVANRNKLGPLQSADIRTTPLQKWYQLTGKHQWLLPWMPRTMENIDLRGYDLIISSSHAVSKGIIPPPTARHICYCHTPMRYAWEMEKEYLDDFKIPKRLRRTIQQKLRALRRWDMTTAKRVDTFIANSSIVQERIKRIYNRDAVVIPPPVSDAFFQSNIRISEYPNIRDPYYLAIGRLVPYKRYDILTEAANRLKVPLKIAGTGQDEKRLRALAGPTVEFLGFVEEEDLYDLYANAKALLFGAFEDAGVVPLEAQACGTPVVCYGKGGVVDTVIDGKTGLYFSEQSTDSVVDAIKRFENMQFDREKIREHAMKYSSEEFRKKFSECVAMQK